MYGRRVCRLDQICDVNVNNGQIKQIAVKKRKKILQVLLHLFMLAAYLIVASNPS